MASTSLTIAVAHAVSFLTRPLILAYPATTIIRLQLILEANLIASFSTSWMPSQPLRGSGRRCLTLSSTCLPPRPIYAACLAAGIQWFDWMALLGGQEFDFFVDPGCVSVRFGGNLGQILTIWSDELPSPAPAASFTSQEPSTTFCPFTPVPSAQSPSKTLAQQLLEEDKEEEDSIFAMIADEVAAPTWMTPILDQFPVPSTLTSTRSSSPLSASSEDSIDSMHSRCSSRSSNSSGTSFSAVSAVSSATSVSTTSSSPVQFQQGAFKQSRRERARQARVFVDISKKEVTPYDGGKTTVLTGGVMLGGAPKPAPTKPTMKSNRSISAANWRSGRV